MEKITFQDGITKGNATTFNQLQDNVEEAINTVEETINEIIESGSNENGYYEKYSNGVLKCYHVLILDKQNTAYHYQEGTWTYPFSFINSPYINATPYNWTTHANTTKVSVSLTSCHVMLHTINTLNMAGEDSINDAVSLVAVGKWK